MTLLLSATVVDCVIVHENTYCPSWGSVSIESDKIPELGDTQRIHPVNKQCRNTRHVGAQ